MYVHACVSEIQNQNQHERKRRRQRVQEQEALCSLMSSAPSAAHSIVSRDEARLFCYTVEYAYATAHTDMVQRSDPLFCIAHIPFPGKKDARHMDGVTSSPAL